MTDTQTPEEHEPPRPSAAEMQRLIAGKLTGPSRVGHVALLFASLVGAGAAAALLLTEPSLPQRTQVALTLAMLIGLSWTAFSIWVLLRRGVLFGKQRVVAARMAVAFTALFTLEAWAVGQFGPGGRPWYGAMALGAAMLGVAIAMLMRARRHVAGLARRRAELERQLIGPARNLVIAVLCIALGIRAAGAQQTLSPPALVMTPGTFSVGGQSVDVTNGRLSVPANRAAGSKATLTIAFVKFQSTAATPSAPIVFLAGGPGDAGTRAVRGMPIEFLNSLRSIADVIAFDQRGTGLSEPLNPTCPPGTMIATDKPANPATMLETLRGRVATCLANAARTGIDVMGLTTTESADDLEDLRRALGVSKLSFLAGSYGTHLALATARRYPSSVHRLVLAGVEGQDDTFKLPSRVDGVLAVIAKAKRATLMRDLRTLKARLATEPARFTFPSGQGIMLGEWDLQRWVSESLDLIPKIDAMIAAIPAMLANDFSALGQWAIGYRVPRPLNLMNLAMDCASYATTARLARIRSDAPTTLLGDAINFPLPDLCDVPGLPRLPDTYRANWTADVPTLLISGTFDGRTPVQNAVDAGRNLPRGRMLVIDGASHGLFREAAVNAALLSFFRE
ncbi:MAG: alpha/beta fold hydrolase [Gemmatimonas sp.]